MTLELPYDAVLPLTDAKGVRIACLDGALWVTQDGDPSDTIVERGKSFQVSRAGKTVIVALRNSRVALDRNGYDRTHFEVATSFLHDRY